MPLDLEVGLTASAQATLCYTDGDPASPPQKRQSPNFRRMSIVVKRLSILIKMSLGTEVGLGLRDTVLDGDPTPHL